MYLSNTVLFLYKTFKCVRRCIDTLFIRSSCYMIYFIHIRLVINVNHSIKYDVYCK